MLFGFLLSCGPSGIHVCLSFSTSIQAYLCLSAVSALVGREALVVWSLVHNHLSRLCVLVHDLSHLCVLVLVLGQEYTNIILTVLMLKNNLKIVISGSQFLPEWSKLKLALLTKVSEANRLE